MMDGPYRCLLDLDGVLVDFVKGAKKVAETLGFGPLDANRWDFIPDELWPYLHERFWTNLDPTPEFKAILSTVEETFGRENVCILTSPCLTPGCAEGKLNWIREHMPAYSRRFLIGPQKDFCANSKHVLIDDADHNVEGFFKAGGNAVLIPRPWNRLKDVPIENVLTTVRSLYGPINTALKEVAA